MNLHDIRTHPDLPTFWFHALATLRDRGYETFHAYYTAGGKLRFRATDTWGYNNIITRTHALYWAPYSTRAMRPDDPCIDWSKV